MTIEERVKEYQKEHPDFIPPPFYRSPDEVRGAIRMYLSIFHDFQPKVLPADNFHLLYFGFVLFHLEMGREVARTLAISLECAKQCSPTAMDELRREFCMCPSELEKQRLECKRLMHEFYDDKIYAEVLRDALDKLAEMETAAKTVD